MQKVQLTYKFRLYPKKGQDERLLETLELCRQTYNYFLAQWNGKQRIPSRLELQAQLPKLKAERPELSKVYSKVLQMVLHQLYSNLKALSRLKRNGKHVGRLRFKGKGWYKSFVYNQSGFKLIKTGKRLDLLHLSKIGDIPIRVHREVEGEIKQIIIKRHNSGKWFACLCVEREIAVKKAEHKRAVGIDVGIKHFLTDSDGRQIENPRFYQKTLDRIKILQHWLSRKKKGSRNREKMKVKLAKVYERLVNQRNDFLHKLSRFYVNNYDVICVEKLNIRNMVRNHNLAQRILDASWGKFIRLLHEKAERAACVVVDVPPRGTSEGLGYEDPYRDWISACRIKMRGWGSPDPPAEVEPLRELIQVPASFIFEAGSPLAFSRG
ncbi:MAG: transposase [Candidatus Terraquivivens tikiterensis]|uniref:Transposase n=1 Tax=Candidatus Terraquivivens tikiterensis TaxID=1980982 RepID=A0A2R7Y5H1_9ARCH|nr:MAG: transposase [Candidatus Terraquivivens tikiterensis]